MKMKKTIVENYSIQEALRALNHKNTFNEKTERTNLSRSADNRYTAIILKETVLATEDVDSRGNYYDTVKDEFIPVTIRANSDKEAVEKIAKYVHLALISV